MLAPRGDSAISRDARSKVRVYRSSSNESIADDDDDDGSGDCGRPTKRRGNGRHEPQDGPGGELHQATVQHPLEESEIADRTLAVIFVVFVAVGTALIVSQFAVAGHHP